MVVPVTFPPSLDCAAICAHTSAIRRIAEYEKDDAGEPSLFELLVVVLISDKLCNYAAINEKEKKKSLNLGKNPTLSLMTCILILIMTFIGVSRTGED